MRVISFFLRLFWGQVGGMTRYSLYLILPLLLWGGPAQADDSDAPKPLGPEYCFPIKDIIKTVEKFDSLKPEKRDIVGPDMSLKIRPEEGELLPERVELRDGDSIKLLEFDENNRSIAMTDLIRASSEAGQFCVVDPDREGRLYKDVGYQLDFGMSIRFKETPGHHSLEQIEEALKDGRSHYKKMAGAMGFMVPKFTHIAISSPGEGEAPIIFATSDGQDIGEPAFEPYDDSRLVSLKTLENMKADGVRIEGPYRISPSPDAKTISKFSGDD